MSANPTLNVGQTVRSAPLQHFHYHTEIYYIYRVWDQLQKSELPPPKEDLAKWEAEFSQLMNAQRDELDDYGSAMQQAWEGGVGNYQEGTHAENSVRFDAEGIPMLGDYVFGKPG